MREANFQPEAYTLLWDNASTHSPSTPHQISPFVKYATDVLGLKEPGIIALPSYSPKLSIAELAFSYLKRGLRKTTPSTIPELVDELRKISKKITGDMICNWWRKCGYIIPGAPLESRAEDPHKDVINMCTLPGDVDNLEVRQHIACYDSKGVLQRHKPPGRKRWQTYTDDDDLSGEPSDLQDLSVVKKSGVRPKKRRKVLGECIQPEGEEVRKIRYTGLNSLPAGVPHGSYEQYFQNDSDNTEIERILDERQRQGKKEYKVRWVGFDSSDDEWLKEDRFTAGLNSLLLYWQEHNKLKDQQKQMNENKKKSTKAKATKVKAINRKNFDVGDVVAIRSPANTELPFHLGKVIKKHQKKFTVHWYGHAKQVDGTFMLEYKSKRGSKKGVAPHTADIWYETVIDTVESMKSKKKGKISSGDLNRLLGLVNEAKKKGRS
jgi:hypothetical protein